MTKTDPQFRELAESLPHMVWTCRGDGPCDYLSPQWVAYTGIPEEAQLGYRWLEQLHPDDVEPTKSRWAAAASSGGAFDTEFRVRRSDGVYRWFKTRAVPARNAAGRVVKWYGTNTDIQELRDAQDDAARLNRDLEARVAARTEELRTANQRLRLATSGARVGVWDWDVARGTVLWDETMQQLYELPGAERVSYSHWRDAVHPDDVARAEGELMRSVESLPVFDTIFRIVCPSGVKHLRAMATFERDATGRVVRAIGVNWDVTEQRLAESALRQNEALQRAILAQAGPAIVATDLDGTITLFNLAAEELLGYAAGEVIGRATPVLLHDLAEIEARRPELARRLGTAIRAPFEVLVASSRLHGADADEWTWLRKDGTRVPVLVTVTTLRDEGHHVLGYLVAAVNVTQRKIAEAELVGLNRLLAHRTRQLEVLLQEIHHRVKNNLQVIASLINMQVRQVPDTAARKALLECRTRILAIALIHEQLYRSSDYSRIPFSDYASQLAANIFAASGLRAGMVELALDLETVALPVETAIPCGLILNELVTNALKHAFPGDRRGTVRIALRPGAAGELELSVADDGVGLGDPDPERSRSLGMELVTELTIQIGGRLEIHDDHGTRVAIAFPRDRGGGQQP